MDFHRLSQDPESCSELTEVLIEVSAFYDKADLGFKAKYLF